MIDKYAAIIKSPSDSTVCDLQMIPQDQKILTVSPTSLSLIDISVPNITSVLSVYNITEKFESDYGLFVSSACLSIKEFTILTSKGRIARFNINQSSQIVLYSISIPRNSYYTCLSQYLHKYYIAGDEKGHFLIFSSDLSILYKDDHLEIPVKQICMSHSYGMIFLADGTLYSFKISSLLIEKKEFKLELYPELEFVEITPSKICVSNDFNAIAVYDPNGSLYIINKKDDMTNHTQRIFNLTGLLAMSFSNSENLLILVFKEKIGIWTSNFKRIFYVYLPEIKVCNCVTVSSKFVALSMIDHGIALYPLIHRSRSTVPLMFSLNKIFEFVPTNDGILSNEHEITISIKNNDSNLIEFASADKYSKFIAIATKSRIFIYNRNSQQMKLLVDKITLIRDIEWFSRNLCVLSFEASNQSFHYYMFKTKKNSSEFQLAHKNKLLSRPFLIQSNNDDKLLISLYKSILIIDKKMNENSIKVPFLLENAYPHTNFIFALTSPKEGQSNLISITYDGQILNLKENVDAFYVSHKFDLLFALSGTDIFITSTSHIRFTTFVCTDSIPIGVTIPNSICAFITIKNNASRIDPSLSFFFDYAISTNEHFSPEKKKKALLALNSNNENKKSIILQSSVFLLRQKKSSDFVSFISNFPDLFNEVLINALRCVESDERDGVYEFVGSPSNLFSGLTSTKIEKYGNETIKFVDEKKDKESINEFKLSSLLLPIVLEDEGFNIAFPATFYLISNISKFRKLDEKEKNGKNSKQQIRKLTQSQKENKNQNSISDNNNNNNANENKSQDNQNNNSDNRNNEENSQNENKNKDSINNFNESQNENNGQDISNEIKNSQNDSENSKNDEVVVDSDAVDDFEFTQNEVDTLSSFFRFVDPILGHVSSIDPDHVSVLGMEMSNLVYSELKQQYEDVVTTKLRRMMKFYRPIQMTQFAVMARYSAHYFLSENKEEYKKQFVDEIVMKVKETTFNRNLNINKGEDEEEAKIKFENELKMTVDLFKRVGLKQWEIAILIAAEKFDEAKNAALNDDSLTDILKKSEWHHVFDL